MRRCQSLQESASGFINRPASSSSSSYFPRVRFADDEVVFHFSLSRVNSAAALSPWRPYSSLLDLPLYCLSTVFGCLPQFMLHQSS